jgi:protein tyrosine/serine phosphatase
MYIIRSGIHETGTLVGCLRKLEGWNFSSIVTEVGTHAILIPLR